MTETKLGQQNVLLLLYFLLNGTSVVVVARCVAIRIRLLFLGHCEGPSLELVFDTRLVLSASLLGHRKGRVGYELEVHLFSRFFIIFRASFDY